MNAALTPCLIHPTTARPAAIAGSACVSRRCCTSCARDCSKGFRPIPSPSQPGQHNRLNVGFSGKPLNWDGLHPWGAAALSLSNDDLPTALHRLNLWQQQGLSGDELQAVLNAAAGSFAVSTALLPEPAPITSPSTLCPVGASPHEWSLHAWLQHLPLPHAVPVGEHQRAARRHRARPGRATDRGDRPTAHRPRQPSAAGLDTAGPGVGEFSRYPVTQLRRLGVSAQWLDPSSRGNGWLEQANDEAAASEQLGVPAVAALAPGILALGRPQRRAGNDSCGLRSGDGRALMRCASTAVNTLGCWPAGSIAAAALACNS